MRITGGRFRGRKLVAPAINLAQPAPDRMREAVFSILQHVVRESRVLDLFACSGSLGIEALSRGADSAVFIDSNPAAIKAVRRNLEELGIAGSAQVIRGDAYRAAEIINDLEIRSGFDLVLIDPPYALSENPETLSGLERLVLGLFESDVVEEQGIVFFRQRKSASPVLAAHEGLIQDIRVYGTARVAFIERPEN